MGAYLSKPVTDKHSSDGTGQYVSFGACTMQGWRKTQEDAHNCFLEFDKETSFFAVYDGHGGHEVAVYAAEHYPQELKNNEKYKTGKMEDALRESFLSFDKHLGSEEGLMNLVELLNKETGSRNTPESDVADNVDVLCQEAQMPLEEVIAKYEGEAKCKEKLQEVGSEDDGAGSSSACSSSHSIGERTESSPNTVKNNSDEVPSIPNKDHEQIDSSDKKPEKCAQTGRGENGNASSQKKVKGVREDLDLPEEWIRGLNYLLRPVRRPIRKPLSKIDAELYESDDDDDDDDDEDEDEDDSQYQQDESSSDNEEGAEGNEEESGNEESSPDEAADENGEDSCVGIVPPESEVPGMESGCTAIVALLRGKDLYVANAGDSRCVLSANGTAVDMSTDHKPEDDLEMNRIVEAGGCVTIDGRVNGGLNLSRAFGDHLYKQNKEKSDEEQMIIAKPDIETYVIDPSENDFMVLACDGIWNYLTSQEVVDFVRERLPRAEKLSSICEELFDQCLAPHAMGDGTGCDNMTAIIVKFLPAIANAPNNLMKVVVDHKSLKRGASPDSTTVDEGKRVKLD